MSGYAEPFELPWKTLVHVLEESGVNVTVDQLVYCFEKGEQIWRGEMIDPCHRRFIMSQAHRFGVSPKKFFDAALLNVEPNQIEEQQ